MEYAHAVKQKHIGDVANQFFILVLGDADVTTNGGMIETVESQLPLRPDAILASKRTDPVARIRDGIALLDPGATEYVLSKGTIDEGPLSRGVNEYQIDGGSLSRYRHELDVREFETFRFEMTEETTLDDIEADIETYDLSNVAVLAKLVGLNAGTQSPSRKQIQRLLSDRAYCARVYDERKSTEEENKHNMSESDNIKIADENFLKTLLTMLDQLNNPPQFSNKETSHLVDLYVALSELERQAGSLRTDIRDELSRWIEVGETASGEHGVVRGRERTRQRLKDEETVKTVLRNHGINVETITTRQIDTKKVKDIVTDESLDIEEADVFEVETTEYIRKEDFETNNDTAGTTTEQNKENKTHKVYLGSGTGVKGWIQVDASVVTEEILPLVKENEVQSEEIPTIAVNFSSEVPIRGWTKVDASIVRKKIEPLVRQHRTD